MSDPLNHLKTVPIYPAAKRVSEKDDRFWASMTSDNAHVVFFDNGRAQDRSLIGELLSNVRLHTDVAFPNRLIFRLEDSSLVDKFFIVFYAIAEDSEGISNDKLCGHIIHELQTWIAFLSPNREGLTDEELRGRWGELFILQRDIASRFSAAMTVDAYTGIYQTPQDLAGRDFSIEVKTTISRAPSSISISSLEQLDAQCSNQLLVLLTLVTDDQGTSITQLENSIVLALGTDFRQVLRFRKMIADALDGATETQMTTPFATVGETAWEVTEGFPALRRTTLSTAILRAKYSIAIQQLSEFIYSGNIGEWIDGSRSS